MSRHVVTFEVDAFGISPKCRCEYDPTDERRPCWPWDVERDEPCRLPAPQPDCTYKDWIENSGIEVVDPFSFERVVTGVDWAQPDAPEFSTEPLP